VDSKNSQQVHTPPTKIRGQNINYKRRWGGGLYYFQSSCSASRKKDLLKDTGDAFIYLFLIYYMTLSNSSYYIASVLRKI
jgi:hypothetical protein